MARRGFFPRFFDLFRRGPRRAPVSKPPTPTPTPTPKRERLDPFQQSWRDAGFWRRAGRSYYRHKELFNEIPNMSDEDEDTQLYLWRSYIDNMVRSGGYRRNDPNNPFWDDIGMDPRDWDWQEWRETMGRITP